MPATHPSAFGRADLQDVAASRSITSAASCARPHPPTEDHLWRNARNWRARTSGLLRRFSLQVTRWRSAQINGLITSGSPIREPRFVSKAAARAELTCVRTSIGTSRLYYKLATPGGISKGATMTKGLLVCLAILTLSSSAALAAHRTHPATRIPVQRHDREQSSVWRSGRLR